MSYAKHYNTTKHQPQTTADKQRRCGKKLTMDSVVESFNEVVAKHEHTKCDANNISN